MSQKTTGRDIDPKEAHNSVQRNDAMIKTLNKLTELGLPDTKTIVQ
ncbi:hypothetical protein [Candidatus Enterovibrio altilux]|uniref:Uncharacterized protein n=1 Tax=Candidatus Enterovibrio altilux TaxID=1927128 RepID=A0A291B8Y4_9GAMM|nr:hypothetical protein [Candidatus Enterovibrio luxaltus]ATF09451.1 hypothetical protein BTN50_0946 [Candidatus Enterovibrio luxaltus]